MKHLSGLLKNANFLLILGFPIALLVGWAYEKLPSQSTNTDGVKSIPQPAHSTPKKTLVAVGVGSCAVIGLFGFYMMPFIFDQGAFEGSSIDGSETLLTAGNSGDLTYRNYRGYRASVLLGATGLRVLAPYFEESSNHPSMGVFSQRR